MSLAEKSLTEQGGVMYLPLREQINAIYDKAAWVNGVLDDVGVELFGGDAPLESKGYYSGMSVIETLDATRKHLSEIQAKVQFIRDQVLGVSEAE